MEPAAVPQQPLSNGSPAQQPSQVPVNVALPVTQWRGVGVSEGFSLGLSKVKHHPLWMQVCCAKGTPQISASSVHVALLPWFHQMLDEVGVAFLCKRWVDILCKQIHGFRKRVQQPGWRHRVFSFLSVCDRKGRSSPGENCLLKFGFCLNKLHNFFCLTEEFKFFFVFWADKLSPYNETLPDRDGIDGVSCNTFPKTESEPLKIPVDLVWAVCVPQVSSGSELPLGNPQRLFLLNLLKSAYPVQAVLVCILSSWFGKRCRSY